MKYQPKFRDSLSHFIFTSRFNFMKMPLFPHMYSRTIIAKTV